VQEQCGAGMVQQRKNMRTMLNRYAIVKLIMHVTCRRPSERPTLGCAVVHSQTLTPALSGTVDSDLH